VEDEEIAMGKPRRRLHKGMEGKDVLDVQRKLNARLIEKIDEDGRFGSNTDTAVRDFQRRNGLVINGEVDDRTWDALNTMLGLVVVTAEPRPPIRPLLDIMIDDAEKALNRQPRPPIRPLLDIMIDDAEKALNHRVIEQDGGSDLIVQFQGQTGGTLSWIRAGGRWKNPLLGPDRSKSVGAAFALTWRSSQDDEHVELSPFGLSLSQNFDTPEWTVTASVSAMYADFVHLGRWHLSSFYTQPSFTLRWFNNTRVLTLPVGDQLSFDLAKDGNCNIFVQGQAAVSYDLNKSTTAISAGVVLGVSVNVPTNPSKLKKLRLDNFCSKW
jgi:peptidoglycan hydrolase-like protein with peptidoglycan-binding domain